ncbi:MAG: UDP-N-acetylmuramoyl-L-alanyl-D-glutamate--2,6-diaminopimelate ligase [Salinisphaera sp.]|nr:UDP-N-acetylmuramoyl-L-alanyl-D-glutamate--2,6-diaminopimelate ligase [Salinisphaera sp.]
MLAPAVMSPQALPHLLAGLAALENIPDILVDGLARDSREVAPGSLFLACAGHAGHGLDYAEQALAAGASAIAWDIADGREPPVLTCPNIRVPGLAQLVGVIAARGYDEPSAALFTAGITGTDGKTSCAWLMARALDALGSRCGYLGTLGFGWPDALSPASHTTPDAIGLQRWLAAFVNADAQSVALEVSSHALAQDRIAGMALDIAVLTQIGRDHLDYHGSVEAYVSAKRRLFDLAGLAQAVINADDTIGRAWLTDLAPEVITIAYGQNPAVAEHAHHVRIAGLATRIDGLVIDFDTHAGRATLDSHLVGAFNAYNLAAVLAVLLARDVSLNRAIAVLAELPTVPGRMERIAGSQAQPLVIVDYAHTAGALEAALTALAAHSERRLLCVFGCGGERDRGKRPLMAAAAARLADQIWVTDDNPRGESAEAIVADILAGFEEAGYPADRYCVVHDRAAAIAAAIAAAEAGDVLLIAGKGHEDSQQIGEQRFPFDDRQVARRVLEAA